MYGLYMNFKKNKELIILLLILLTTILIIGRPYNLFVNDDGIFIRNVKNFFDGNYSLHPLTAPTFYLQAVTGLITTKVFGFSVENLRLLNIFLGLITSILTFIFLSKISNNKLNSLILTLTFYSNPFFWFLSYSYMTDIHFFLLAIISLILFYKYLINQTYKNVFFVAIAISLLFLVRQLGLIFAFGFFASIFIINKKIKPKDFLILLIPALTYLWYQLFAITPEYAEAGIIDTLKNLLDYEFMTKVFLTRVFNSSVYIGLFILPLTPIFILNYKKSVNLFKARYIFITTLISTPLIIKLLIQLQSHFTFPTLQNVLTLKGFYPSGIPSSDRFVNYPLFYNLHTSLLVIGTLCFVLLLWVFISKIPNLINLKKHNKTILLASLINFFIITLLTLVFRAVYDRYIFLCFFLFLIPLSFLINFQINKFSTILSITLIMILLSTSIIFEKDYISWNKKRNEIITYATTTYNQNICDLEGAGEWEDYLYYDCKDIQEILMKNLRISWQDTDNVEGNPYTKLKEFKFDSMLGLQQNKLYLLKKVEYED